MSDEIRVLLVDDSPTVRAVLQRILRKTEDLRVVGEAGDGEAGLRLAVELEPDVVLMDIAMPGVDGFEATTRIMEKAPTAVMVFSTEVSHDGHRVFEAYSRGARDVVAKPGTPEAWTELVETLPKRIRTVAQGFAGGGSEAETGIAASSQRRPPPPLNPIRYLAIGSSTGGPEALHELLSVLAPRPPVAILVVQHIAKEFEQGLADWLRSETGLSVRIAEPGEVPKVGTVRMGPQGYHLRLGTDGRLELDEDTPPLRGHRPAADVLLDSCATTAGRQTAGVLLSGMGRDGVEGLRAVKDAGGVTLAQNQASSVVFGMPQAALAAGATEVALPPDGLARYVLDCCSSPSIPPEGRGHGVKP